MNQTGENGQKVSFRPDFDSFGSNLPPSPPLHAFLRKTNEPNSRKW